MDERELQLVEMIRQNRRREKIRKFFHKSKLVWIFDPYPHETHKLYQRSVIESYKRDKIRQTYSWHNIARLQNEKAFKAGLAGIVTAPILAGLSISKPLFISFSFPIQMAFIFLSGILFVLAASIYNTRVPDFVRRFVESEESKKYKAIPMREIRSSIFLEFLKLGRTIEITPENIHELNKHQMAFQAAGIFLMQGGSCFKVGFDASGIAIIEKLLYRLAKKYKFKIYEEYKMEDDEIGLRERYGRPGVCYTAKNIYLRHLSIQNAKEHFVVGVSPERVCGTLNDNDIVIDFYDPYIQTEEQIEKIPQVEPYTHGLDKLLREEYIDTIVEELSYWQSWQRPLSRVSSLLLYRMSLLSFVVFLFFQGTIVLQAI